MKTLRPVVLILSVTLLILAWGTYSLYIDYREYRNVAETELTDVSERIMDAQVKLIEMKNTCNALLPVYPDAGNDKSNGNINTRK